MGVGVDVKRTPLDNRSLLDACRNGDASAWSRIVDRYERLVYAIALREGLSQHDAADVAQETFTALIKGVDTITDPERLPAWLITVARRRSWRRLGRQSLPLDDLDDDAVTADDVAADTARALWVYEAVQDLGEPCRSLVIALFFDPAEPSYAEIALRLGRPVGSVGPLRARCLDRLRAVLEQAAG